MSRNASWIEGYPSKLFAVVLMVSLGLLVVEQYEIAASITSSKDKLHHHEIHQFGKSILKFGGIPKNSTVKIYDESLACSFPDIDPFDSEMMKLSGLENSKVKCEGQMPDLVYIKDNWLEINQTQVKAVAGFISCKYQAIFVHPAGDINFKTGEWSERFTSKVQLSEDSEFLVTICENNSSETISETYHTLIPKSRDLAEELSLKLKRRNAIFNPKETLSVIIIGMDSVPRNHYIRTMNKTYRYLMNELSSFDLSMHTQVGANTYPNYLAFLTGNYENEIRKWWQPSWKFDAVDLVWKDFETAGYRTLYTEDQPHLGAFHLGRNGFKRPPTHHYSRPVLLAAEYDRAVWKAGEHCLGNQPEITFHYDYVKKFLETFKGDPLWAMCFNTRISHDDATTTKMADDHTYDFYKYLKESGHLNKSLLISFSDHGFRWGPIRQTNNGLVESRAPYTILTFPKWFTDKYPDVAMNLKANTRRLTTHFDTHATLRDLIYFKSDRMSPLIPGIHGKSIFGEIPKSRVCEDIPISMEFCLCGQSQMQVISNSPELSHNLANLVLRIINQKTNKRKCANLSLGEIVKVTHFTHSKGDKREQRVFKIRFTTSPGGALYEGTVTTAKCEDSDLLDYFKMLEFGKNNNTLLVKVGAIIDRLNFYRGQADCEWDVIKKAYCYCQNLVLQES